MILLKIAVLLLPWLYLYGLNQIGCGNADKWWLDGGIVPGVYCIKVLFTDKKFIGILNFKHRKIMQVVDATLGLDSQEECIPCYCHQQL
jgi:hypothetical protein